MCSGARRRKGWEGVGDWKGVGKGGERGVFPEYHANHSPKTCTDWDLTGTYSKFLN